MGQTIVTQGLIADDPKSSIYEELMRLKGDRFEWFNKIITATTKKDFEMNVWNGTHPVEENSKKHICKAGTRVRIWMVSRFGDVGITDNLKDSHGYDARIDVEDLEDLDIQNVKPEPKKPLEGIPTV